jgi:hypothetical protein
VLYKQADKIIYFGFSCWRQSMRGFDLTIHCHVLRGDQHINISICPKISGKQCYIESIRALRLATALYECKKRILVKGSLTMVDKSFKIFV